MPESEPNSLVKVPSAVVEHLKDEPVLLGGMGAGGLIAIIAVFAPAGAQVYGWIVGGLMLVLCLGKLILDASVTGTRAAGQPSQDAPAPPGDSSNEIKIGGRSRIENSRVSGSRNRITLGKRTVVKGTTVEAGTPRAGDGEIRPR